MTRVYKRPASEVGIRVGYHRGFEQHGRTFLTTYGCGVIGGQCSKCHAIVWTHSRKVEIFNRPLPAGVPEFGTGYTKYAKALDAEFLQTLSPCPQCGATNSFDLFVNNMTLTKYEDGTEEEKIIGKEFYDTPNPQDAWVWWAEFT